MLALQKAPVRAKSIARLAEAEEFFSDLWLLGLNYVNKSQVNKAFGRNQANTALARFFVPVRRGSNLSGKLTEITPRDLDDLPSDRQQYLLDKAVNGSPGALEAEPTESDETSAICIRQENLQAAIDWCIKRRKFQFIRPVKILMEKDIWKVYYKLKTDRYYAIWPFCLTNWPSELRKIILSGTDYDTINAIGQFILERLADEINKYPEAKSYFDNPKEMRLRLAAKLCIEPEQAKKVLHATVNGVGTSQSMILKNRSALVELISESQALRYLDEFQQLISELKKIRKLIAPNNKEFIREYFAWERTKTGTIFNGTGLIMHDGLDGCSVTTIIPAQSKADFKMSEGRGVWDEDSVVDRLIQM